MTDTHLRASSAPSWLQCARRESWHATNASPRGAGEEEPAGNVATVYGNMVHELVTGDVAEIPRRIRYDQHTRSENELMRQVRDAEKAVKKALDEFGTIERREEYLAANVTIGEVSVKVDGHIDLVVLDRHGHGVHLLDIKTGLWDPHSSWAQMSIYCWLAEQAEWVTQTAILLWAPRGKVNGMMEPKTSLVSRGTAALAETAMATIRHVAASATNPVSAPGMWCRRCPDEECVYQVEEDDA